MFVEFMGATMTTDDNGTRKYTERGKVGVNPFRVDAVYDHAIMTGNNVIRVMEDYDKIVTKFNRAMRGEDEFNPAAVDEGLKSTMTAMGVDL